MKVRGRIYQRTDKQVLFGISRERWGWLPLSYIVWANPEDASAPADGTRRVTIEIPAWLHRKVLGRKNNR